MDSRKRKRWIVAGCVLGPILLLILADTVYSQRRALAFVDDAAHDFRLCHSLTELTNLPDTRRPGYTQTFANGEWVAVKMEHACCTGAGFNATVVYDSAGRLSFNTTRTFCGYEQMSSAFKSVPAGSLKEFYGVLRGLWLRSKD